MGKPPPASDDRRPASDKQMLDSIDASQQYLADRVRRLKRTIQNDRYEDANKLSIALDRMIAKVIKG